MADKQEQAAEQGWVPKDVWIEEGKSADEWVDAGEFVRRGELFERIKSQTGQLRTLNTRLDDITKQNAGLSKTVKTLGEHNKKIAEESYKKALRELKKEAMAAQADGDLEAAADIEVQIDELKDAAAELKRREAEEEVTEVSSESSDSGGYDSPEAQAAFQAWVGENPWFTEDDALRGAANGIGATIDHTQMPPAEFLKELKRQMVSKFPEKLGNPRRRNVALTEPGPDGGAPDKGSKSKSGYTVSDLNSDQKEVMRHLISAGAPITEQEYVDQLADLNELG